MNPVTILQCAGYTDSLFTGKTICLRLSQWRIGFQTSHIFWVEIRTVDLTNKRHTLTSRNIGTVHSSDD